MKKISLTQGRFAIVDDIDFEYLMQWKWYCRFDYAIRMSRKSESQIKVVNRKLIHMHREVLTRVLGNDDFEMCDHINSNRLDNRRLNLRPATRSQNHANSNPRTSQFKGVFKRSKNSWCATISFNGTTRYLGSFDNPIEAAKAYNKAAIECFGEFSKLNDV